MTAIEPDRLLPEPSLYAERRTKPADGLAVRLTVPLLTDAELAEIRIDYLEATEQGDAVLAAKRTAEHLARTALMRLIPIDPRHERAHGARARLRRGFHR